MSTTQRPPTPRAPLGELNEEERNAAYDRLQSRLPAVWRSMRLNEPGESVVVVPSVSLDRVTARAGAVNQAMEERYLFLLLLLRQPRLRMVYVTSGPVDPAIVEYYLALLPGVIPSHARARLSLVSVGDLTPRPLTEKLLERPRLLADIAALIPDRARSHLVPYTTTRLERDLALELGIPMYGADPRHFALGTKTGCRRLFDEAGVDCPAGFEDLRSVDDIVGRARRAARPTTRRRAGDGQAQRGGGRCGQRPRRPRAGCRRPGRGPSAPRCRPGADDGAGGQDRHARPVLREVRRTRRDRRGADPRRGGAQPQRAAADHPAR